MKKLISTMMVMFMIITLSYSQNQPAPQETVTIPKSELTSDQLKKIEMDNQIEKIKQYGEWVGVGKEVGVAVREGLTAVVDVADKFGNTDVGKFTMIMVAWKILGEDIIKIILGIAFLIIVNTFIFKVYKTKFMTYRIRESGVWWKFWEESKYIMNKPSSRYDGIEFVRLIYIALVGVSFLITYALMFN
jgi:hypothetical protein